MKVLTVNPGSNSVRMIVLDGDDDAGRLHVDKPATDDDAWNEIADFIAKAGPPDAIAHRLVHGGDAVRRPTKVDARVLGAVREATSLAPLHIPATLRLVDGLAGLLPGVAQVLCPDTAFHAEMPESAATYAVPAQWRASYGLRRYGFHGLSYAWTLRRTADLLGRDASELQFVAAHLGGGASVCAIRDGHGVDTSMGFTPLDGVPMSRRSGSVDPGMLLWLLDGRMSRDDLDYGLNHESGLYGLSAGRSDDTRQLVRAAAAGDHVAQLALDVYAHRVRREFAAAATSLDRVDAVVFTGEIGWDQPEVRTAICSGLGQLGVRVPLDDRDDADDRIVSPSASTPVLVILAQENRQIALDALTVLEG
jgi:acetate kinase